MSTRRLLALAAGTVLLTAMCCFAAPPAIRPPPDVTRLVTDAPQPDYPAEALQRHASGSGVFLLRVEIRSGRVEQVIVGRTTGDRALDAAAVKALQAGCSPISEDHFCSVTSAAY